jgi:glutathione S-transferase
MAYGDLKLYYQPHSSNSRKVIMAALLLGLDIELVPKARATEYSKINPMGKVPTLVDGGFVLWESNAIMQYLADKTPGATLYPTAALPRADVNRWLFWGAAHWQAAIHVLMSERVAKQMHGRGDPDPKIVEFGETEFLRYATALNEHLENRTYVVGDALTIADLALAVPLMNTARAKLPIGGFSNIQTWFARIQSLDAWSKTEPPSQPQP